MTEDYCLSCGKEMRKWIEGQEWNEETGLLNKESGNCVSMCITDGCIEQGIVHRAIQNHNDIKIVSNITI